MNGIESYIVLYFEILKWTETTAHAFNHLKPKLVWIICKDSARASHHHDKDRLVNAV
jgi:hypothetical protein